MKSTKKRHKAHIVSCKFTATAGSIVILMWLVLTCPAYAGQPDTQLINHANQLQQAADSQDNYVSGEVLVVLSSQDDAQTEKKQQYNDADIKTLEDAVGGTVVRQISLSQGRRILRIKLPEGKTVANALAENWYEKDKNIESVEPNYRVRVLALPNDSYWSYLWALNNTGQTGGTAGADIDMPQAWEITTGSDSVTVAVIDTGIDYHHPDLVGNMWTNSGEIPANNIDDDNNGFIDDVYGYDFCENDADPLDENSHGTHCAGIIAGVGNNNLGVAGINWRCKLMACRFLDENGSGSVTDAIDAINYAVSNGADILSNSWGGGGYSQALKAAITNAKDHGVLFVAAAGNSGTDNDQTAHYPASYDASNIIAVAATDHNDALASFSCYGDESVHLAAPGVSILSCVKDGGYAWYSGTSMAAPHVAAVAALLLANDPEMPLMELKSRLVWTGDSLSGLDGRTISGRRLNAYNALTSQDCLQVLAPQGGQSWVQGFSWTIKWMSIGGNSTVDIYLLKAGQTYTQLADDTENDGVFSWEIPGSLPTGADYSIWIDDGVNTDQSDANFTITDESTDYFTESFFDGLYPFDMSNKSLILIPNNSSGYYAYVSDINKLPTDTNNGSILDLGDDDAELITLSSGKLVQLYDNTYSSFYVASNGNITFEQPDTDYSETIADHFNIKRISCFFHDFNPTISGSVRWKQFADRVAITWQNLPEYRTINSSTFQAEMFFDGRIRLSWLAVAAESGIVGLSQGRGTAVDFEDTDISEYPDFVILPVIRFWSTAKKRHFYTINENEKDYVIAKYPGIWQYEGVAYYAPQTNLDAGCMPVYRFWSGKLSAHFYTINEGEKDYVITKYPDVWAYEGIAFYAWPQGQQPQDTKPVYRFWSPKLKTHFFTINEAEKDTVIRQYPDVWTYEGIAWYAYEL